LFVVLLMMLHPTQELEPPANPARFKRGTKSELEQHGYFVLQSPRSVPLVLAPDNSTQSRAGLVPFTGVVASTPAPPFPGLLRDAAPACSSAAWDGWQLDAAARGSDMVAMVVTVQR
jgi:hypothetical protein